MTKINIAIVTDNGTTISQHFGRAKYYEVLHIENGEVVKRERREKMGHHNFYSIENNHVPGEQHGVDAVSHNKHVSMAEEILLRLLKLGENTQIYLAFATIEAKEKNIDEAVQAVINESIINHTEKLH